MSKTGVAIRAPSAACEFFLACAGSYSRPHVPGVRAPVIGLTCVPVLALSTLYGTLGAIPGFPVLLQITVVVDGAHRLPV